VLVSAVSLRECTSLGRRLYLNILKIHRQCGFCIAFIRRRLRSIYLVKPSAPPEDLRANIED